jgi:hypothetical protein
MAARIGDIIEVVTRKGCAYAQHTHRHPVYGALIRVFEGTYPERPGDFEAISQAPIAFSVFFPLNSALRQKVVTTVAITAVATWNQVFPVFRSGTPHHISKKVETWWLWDGVREWMVGNLTPDQRSLPIRGVGNVDLLVSRIEEGWRPELDAR